MSLEGQHLDHKSLRAVTGKTADWSELAKDCVAFANALGGRLLIGVEDGHALPPPAVDATPAPALPAPMEIRAQLKPKRFTTLAAEIGWLVDNLRGGLGNDLLEGGADVRVVQELLGHSSVATTQIYTLVTVDRLREIYATAHPRARN